MLDPLVHGIVGNPQILGYLTDRKPAVSYIDLVLVLGFHGSDALSASSSLPIPLALIYP
mgnify:CR=1 FL=1